MYGGYYGRVPYLAYIYIIDELGVSEYIGIHMYTFIFIFLAVAIHKIKRETHKREETVWPIFAQIPETTYNLSPRIIQKWHPIPSLHFYGSFCCGSLHGQLRFFVVFCGSFSW
jgi:hypothetical protein